MSQDGDQAVTEEPQEEEVVVEKKDEHTSQPTSWPEHYKKIPRIKFKSIEQMLEAMKPQAEHSEPLIIEDTNVVKVDAWASINHLKDLLSGKKVLVKKSRNCKFRYFDLKKNIGKFEFIPPLEEEQQTLDGFLSQGEQLLEKGSPERMYLQETLSGHSEMAEEFGSWRWELLIRVSSACGWGLPDSNELFVGMVGAETPLHFDERENLFFQVRGRKEIVTFPFTSYTSLYPFPTTHPCDRQSMVGDPRNPDLTAFPRFRGAVGHYGELKAGDLLYLPYGWWHWLRNMEHLATSISFWSTTPPNDLSGGVPDMFSDHMLTRVRRNLESIIAQQQPSKQNEIMLGLKDSLCNKKDKDPHLEQVRHLLTAVKIPPEKQDEFLLETIEGRFGIDWNLHV